MNREHPDAVMKTLHRWKANSTPSFCDWLAETKCTLLEKGLDVMSSRWALTSCSLARFLGKVVAGSVAMTVLDVALSAIGLLLMFSVLLLGTIRRELSRDASVEHSIPRSSRLPR
jgi:hypothetical protein